MATVQLSPPEIGYIDKQRAKLNPGPGDARSQTFYDACQSNDTLDTYLLTKGLTQTALNGMTQNDKVYAVRMYEDRASI